MRIMALGDTHADSKWCREVTAIAGAHGVERIVQVGDFGYWPRMDLITGAERISLGEWLINEISVACIRHGVDEWIVIDGNHDDHKSLQAIATDPDTDGLVHLGPHVRYSPRGNSFTLGDTLIGTLGGAASIDAYLMRAGVELAGEPYQVGWNWFPELECPTLDDVDRLPSSVDVLFTHEAPIEVDLSHLNGFPGIYISPEIQRDTDAARYVVSAAVAKTTPKLLVHGHWHGRNRAVLQMGEHACDVVGLASNSRRTGRDERSFLIVDLPDLTVKTVKSSL